MQSDRDLNEPARRRHMRRQLRRSRRRAAAAALLIMCGVVAFTAGTADAAPALTVTPNTGLTNGQTVAVSGTGFAANSAGGVIQCSTAAGQPTIAVLGNNVPVSCSNPLSGLATSNASGVLTLPSFAVGQFTTRPCRRENAATDGVQDCLPDPC